MAALESYPDEAAAPEATAPQVLVRTFVLPAGLPWDQARAAKLEAQHGAPLAIGELLHRVRRLDPWGLGRPARYAVFYVRRRDYVAPFEAIVDVDGETHRVPFGGASKKSAGSWDEVRGAGLVGLALVALALAFAGATNLVLTARSQATQRLELAERAVAVKLHAAQRAAADQARLTALDQVRATAGAPGDVVDDLSWLARARTPDARIVAVHWDHGLMAIEARGASAPLAAADRPLSRGGTGRSGITLWGVGRPEALATGPTR